MKKNLFIFTAILSLISANAFAASFGKFKANKDEEGFFLKTFATIEYSAPSIGGGREGKHFRSDNLGDQIKNFNNIAIGANLRVHKFLGFNINWAQSDLSSGVLNNVALSRKANFGMNHYNFSALFYAPKVDNILEFFAEAGISDMRSRLNYVDTSGNLYNQKSHTTAFLYGAGFQITPFKKSQDAIRFSFQKYSPQSSLLNQNYTTFRIGYLKAF